MTRPPQLLCLCAAWCHLCTAYEPVFAAVAQRLRADWPELSTRWIDIEDEAELVGDLDVETFPTLVVLRGTRLLFLGPLTPQPDVLERVVRGVLDALNDADADAAQDPQVAAFAQRVSAGVHSRALVTRVRSLSSSPRRTPVRAPPRPGAGARRAAAP